MNVPETMISTAHEIVQCWPLQEPMMLRCKRCGRVGDIDQMFRNPKFRCTSDREFVSAGRMG